MITIQRQPNGSKTCGQHCVAMLAGVPVEQSISVFGHQHSTQTKEQIAALKSFGIGTAPKYLRYKFKKELPMLCILRLKHTVGRGSHVAVFDHGLVYCPAYGVFGYNVYIDFVKHTMRKVSFLEIFKQ